VQEIKLQILDTNEVIVTDLHHANTFWKRFKGLMGTKILPEQSGLYINPCSQIHTCFMQYSIDLIYLDQSNAVVGIEENLAPWKIGKRFDNVKSVIELPANTIQQTSLKVGQKIALTD
jgi:uncharacterized protein